ncbi:MAG: hypothetical protein K6A43_05285 [Treponema sp.]|nr:hypothetical protein [Treponema sp.]
MREKIYELLKKIDDMKFEKYDTAEENRIFLKRLYLDEAFRNQMIESMGEQKTLEFLEKTYDAYCKISKEMKELVEECEAKDELRDTFGKDVFTKLVENEEEKDRQIETKL